MTEWFREYAKRMDQYGVLEAPEGGIAFTDATPFASSIKLARTIKKGSSQKVTYSYWRDIWGSGYRSDHHFYVLFAGDKTRPAELHYAKDEVWKSSSDDPHKRTKVVLSKGTSVEMENS